MNATATARDTILDSIRRSLPLQAAPLALGHANLPRDYQRQGTLSREQCLELFLDRLLDYDTEVLQIAGTSEISSAIATALQTAGEDTLLASPDFPAEWLPEVAALQLDHNLSSAQIEKIQAVVTTCEAAVASTGTIFLVHGGAQGRRIATLLPDYHICIVRRQQVSALVPEAITAVAPFRGLPITSISGPSATSDIEMTRIRGVHGPRRLTVVLCD
jgi:L-lactate dehydrogenase complex protein LldG